MTNSTCIIFDLFGVILSSGLQTSAAALSQLFQQPTSRINPVYKKWSIPFDSGAINAPTFWAMLNADLGTHVDWTILNKTVLDSYFPIPGGFELVDRFAKCAPVVLLSNTRREWFTHLDNKFSISKHFQRTFLSFEMQLVKPDVKIYKVVLDELRVRPSNVVFIDDDRTNLRPATKLGIRSLLFESAYESECQIRHCLRSHKPKYRQNWVRVLLLSPNGDVILHRGRPRTSGFQDGRLTTFKWIVDAGDSSVERATRYLNQDVGLAADAADMQFLMEMGSPHANGDWSHSDVYWLHGIRPEILRVADGAAETISVEDACRSSELTPTCSAIVNRYRSSATHEQ